MRLMETLTERLNLGNFMIKGDKVYLIYSIIAFLVFLLGLDSMFIDKVLVPNTQNILTLAAPLFASTLLLIRYLIGRKKNKK
jgi:hypothetical protein